MQIKPLLRVFSWGGGGGDRGVAWASCGWPNLLKKYRKKKLTQKKGPCGGTHRAAFFDIWTAKFGRFYNVNFGIFVWDESAKNLGPVF